MYILYYDMYEGMHFIAVSRDREKLEQRVAELAKQWEVKAAQDAEHWKKYHAWAEIQRQKVREFLLRNMDAIREERPRLSLDCLLGCDKDWHTADGRQYHPKVVALAKEQIIEDLSRDWFRFLPHHQCELTRYLDLEALTEPLLTIAEDENPPYTGQAEATYNPDYLVIVEIEEL